MTSLSICTFLRNISIYTFHGNVVVAEDHIAFYPVVNLSLNRTVVRFSKAIICIFVRFPKVVKRIFVRLFHFSCPKAVDLTEYPSATRAEGI